MTTEEKAKAYDIIIQRVTELYETGTTLTREQMEHLFPELRESEDEMIRKAILAEYKERLELETIAYRNPECNKDMVSFLKKVVAYLEKQKEQKPVDYDHEMWKNCEANFEGGKKEVIEHPEKYGLQKAVEWSEEDEDRIEYIVGSLESLKKYVRENVVMSEEYKEYMFRRLEQEKSWLKSLRLQPKQEWSEEDENGMFSDIIVAIRAFYRCRREDLVNYVKFLRSWKPSEEQMRGLKFFLDFHRSQRNAGTTNWREYDAVESLYEQLKKL